MAGGVVNALNRRLGRVFPERRIYIRSDARTRYWTITPISQAASSVALAAMLGWGTLTSFAYIDGATDGRTAENRLEATRDAYEIKLAALLEQQRLLEEELNRSNTRGDVVTEELSEKQKLLVATVSRLRNAESELTGLRAEFEVVLEDRRAALREADALREDVVALRLSLGEAQDADNSVAQTMDAFTATISDVIRDRDAATKRAASLDNEVVALQTEIDGWEGRQEHLLAQLEDATKTSLSALDGLFVGSDVNLESLLKQTSRDYTGRGGGPVERDPDAKAAASPAAEGERVAALMTDMERMSLMRVAIDRLPFGMPTTSGARRTSGYGVRRDPYRRSARMHNGVDFAAPVGTPIYSTGEGVVTFSGRQSGYGIVVKIRHAFGFETVYAHLSKTRVKVGQRVSRGDRIADMGSTGRSTGSHLHYEIRIDNKPINPSKFIRANRNVL